MVLGKVVARFKDGSLIKGNTKDFSLSNNEFHLELINGEIKKIDTEKLKALFCVKTFEGNKNHVELYTDVIPKGGRKIIVEFNDGEIIIGYTQIYTPELQGFFLIPSDLESNIEHIYVITSATKNITISEKILIKSIKRV
jgi:hypothetical protein